MKPRDCGGKEIWAMCGMGWGEDMVPEEEPSVGSDPATFSALCPFFAPATLVFLLFLFFETGRGVRIQMPPPGSYVDIIWKDYKD